MNVYRLRLILLLVILSKLGLRMLLQLEIAGKNAASFSPANHPSVIAVSAIVDSDGKCGGKGISTSYGADDRFASFSNYGSVVDLAAPGVSIYSTYKGGTYATLSGTSMASPTCCWSRQHYTMLRILEPLHRL